jgi:outer membrane protein insertion porin family
VRSDLRLGRARRAGTGALPLSLLVGLAVLGWVGAAGAQERAVPQVRDITVAGNRRIQAAVVLNRVQTRIGDPFSPAAIRDDVRAVFALGYFEDVQVRVEEFEGGVRVIFVVVERPLLREVSFEGNREVSSDDLREKGGLRVGVVYNPVEVQRSEEAIREKYEEEAFFGVAITPRTERTPEGDLRVVFRIEEGRKLYIDRIVIEGNQSLTARQIKGAMATQERFLWVLPFSKVQRKVFEDDADRILQLYADHGFIQARIESHEILPDLERGKIVLRTRLVEGPQFRVGTVTIQGNETLPEAEIRRLLLFKEGDVFGRSRLRRSLLDVADRYSEIGRPRAEITPTTETDAQTQRISIALTIREGGEVYVERINISGNVKTSEKVLRRELRLVEGELFTRQRLVRSRQRLFNLGYFEEVTITESPGSTPDRTVVNVAVKERATGLFSIGAGYSSADGLFGTIDIRETNLFGRGYDGRLAFRLGSETQLAILSFTDPYFLDTQLRAGFDVYSSEREYDDFTEERLGGDLRVRYPLAEYLAVGATYRLEEVTVKDVAATASEDLKKEEGTRLNSVIEFGLARDTRDNPFEPTRGSRNSVDVFFAGLGGDTQYYKVVGESAWYFPLPILDWVLGVRGLAGYARGWGGEDLPIFERFFLGGANTLRGFRTRSVGPKDAQGNVIGGDSEILFSAELLIPVIARFRLAVFADAGNAYGYGTDFDPTDLRYDFGVGVRIFSPLGPLRLDVGFNPEPRNGEKSYQLNFTVGAPF